MEIKNCQTLQEGDYPLLLQYSKYSPKQLYAIGTLPAPTKGDDEKSPVGIAMVGTRRPSNNAKELCRRLVNSLKGTRAIVVSGLAQGIDSLCHEAAIEAGIPTIAVLGQGVLTRIEGSRGELARRIIESGGAIISEFEPDYPAFKGNFPARNRIITGLCAATIIVQSKAKGGALITGELCRNEGKPLYAIPGDFDSEVAVGPNQLLDQGLAKPVFMPESLAQVLRLPKKSEKAIRATQTLGMSLSPKALKLFSDSNGFRKTFTELQSEFDDSTSELLAILTELEIAGLVHTDDNFLFYFNGNLEC